MVAKVPQSSSGMGDIIVSGGLVAGIISLCANGFKVLGDSMSFWLPVGSKGITQIPLGFSTALLGAGYLIGIASGIAIPSWCTHRLGWLRTLLD